MKQARLKCRWCLEGTATDSLKPTLEPACPLLAISEISRWQARLGWNPALNPEAGRQEFEMEA